MINKFKFIKHLLKIQFIVLFSLGTFASTGEVSTGDEGRVPVVESINLDNEINEQVDKKLGGKSLISIAFGDGTTGIEARRYHEQLLFQDLSIFPTIMEKDRHKITGEDDLKLSDEDFLYKLNGMISKSKTVVMHYAGHGVKNMRTMVNPYKPGHSVLIPSLPYGGIKLSRDNAFCNTKSWNEYLKADKSRQSVLDQQFTANFCWPVDMFVGYDEIVGAIAGRQTILFNDSCYSRIAKPAFSKLSADYILASNADSKEVTNSFASKTGDYFGLNKYEISKATSTMSSEIYKRMHVDSCKLDKNQDHWLTVSELLADFPKVMSGELLLKNKMESITTLEERRDNLMTKVNDSTNTIADTSSHAYIDSVVLNGPLDGLVVAFLNDCTYEDSKEETATVVDIEEPTLAEQISDFNSKTQLVPDPPSLPAKVRAYKPGTEGVTGGILSQEKNPLSFLESPMFIMMAQFFIFYKLLMP